MFTPNLPGVDERDHLDSIDEVDDTHSQTDSAIGTDYTPDTSTALRPQTRDISMDSISSGVWGDVTTPGGATGGTPMSPGRTTSVAKNGAAGSTLSPPDGDTEVVRDDIRLLRQMSSELSQEAEERREAKHRWRRFQIILISTVTAIVAAYVAYKKLHRWLLSIWTLHTSGSCDWSVLEVGWIGGVIGIWHSSRSRVSSDWFVTVLQESWHVTKLIAILCFLICIC